MHSVHETAPQSKIIGGLRGLPFAMNNIVTCTEHNLGVDYQSIFVEFCQVSFIERDLAFSHQGALP